MLSKTGEVWELKKDSKSYSCRTAVAQKQLGRYVSGRLKWNPTLSLKRPYHTKIEPSNFTVATKYYIYDVTYWYEGNGILRYSYTVTKTKELKQSERVALTIIMLVLTAYYNSQAEEYGYPPIAYP